MTNKLRRSTFHSLKLKYIAITFNLLLYKGDFFHCTIHLFDRLLNSMNLEEFYGQLKSNTYRDTWVPEGENIWWA